MTNDEAIEIIECGDISNRWGKDGEEVEKMAIKALEQESKTGHWIERIERDDWDDSEEVWYECNQCHLVSERASNYCPNCGAKMAESEVQE